MTLLQRSLQRGRLAHAYLFAGEDLTRLETVGRTFAKVLNCHEPNAAGGQMDSCDRCSSCRRIEADNHPDVLWVRPASKLRVIRVAQVRDLMHAIYLKPTEARWKVALLAAAERLNDQAANALLKTLEEPPANAVLILLSSRPDQLMDTVISRCLRLRFASGADVRGGEGKVDDWLREFAQGLAGGRLTVLERYRLLGTLLARLASLREQIANELQERSQLEANPDAEPDLKEKWETELAAAVEAEYRRRRGELLSGLEWLFRDVWILASGLGGELLMLPGMAESAERLARRLRPADAMENLRAVARMIRLLETNAQEALVLEVGLLKLCL